MERRELFLCPAEFCSGEREGGNAKVIFVPQRFRSKGQVMCTSHKVYSAHNRGDEALTFS